MDEQMRSRGSFEQAAQSRPSATVSSTRDPDMHMAQQPQEESGEASELWKLLPAIQHLPESMLKKLPMSSLFQLNSALGKESKASSRMNTNTRLTMNAQQLLLNPVQVAAGQDDRKNIIHPARFLGGVNCSGQQMWLHARELIGLEGVVPIGNYDMDSIGFGGCVTLRGWLEIHKPSSVDLKLKLFYMPNVSSSALSTKKLDVEDGSGSISIGDSLKEIADLEGLRAALNAAREAMAFALPWNRSISAIHGFMSNSNFCKDDLSNNPRRAAILVEFIDYVFGRNALNWENKQLYLSADDLSHVWASWKGKRSCFMVQQASEKTKKGQSSQFKAKQEVQFAEWLP